MYVEPTVKDVVSVSGHARPVAVEVAKLRKEFGTGRRGVVAVADVDLKVYKGELLVLLGPSGCGKTTLLRSIAGLETPTSGSISVGGQQVYSAEGRVNLPPERRRLGMMFQSYALWPHMTVFANVAYPLASKGLRKDQLRDLVARTLANLSVDGLEHRYPGELSGGQQQRVALARAIVASPSVLLFDEPLSNVDARVRRNLRSQIRELKERTQFAGIYVTHDQEEAMELADSLAVMEHGQIKQIGSSRDVYKAPASHYVAAFVGEINRLAAEIVSSSGPMVASTPLGLVELAVPSPLAKGTRGGVVVRPERIALRGASSAKPPGSGLHAVGRIVDATYLGASLEIRVIVNGADLLVVMSDPAWEGSHLAVGMNVHVEIEAKDLQWLAN